ncbi:DUF3850 domain-containing protein [Anaerobutyricum hallii]|uniref:DUF3850 domain-containing protein n=1 Tax=Anaerobutyricum hallii TaxID=39488 RepID=UPI000E734EF8|nr:DUF3850 domain-containing protein [Anaerobutyricum hallii]RJW41974.1 DUF3850 domain-containing protein [Lachnospiraceae bacterium TF09-5]
MGEILQMNRESTGYSSYSDFKESMDTVVERVEEGFVQIGYHLKVARDTDILNESGYSNMNEFAEAEYGLDKSAVSRFISINDRFSEGGYSPSLQEKYRGFGRAKLSIMLTLPDSINEELTSEYSKVEIKEIKDEVDREQKITELELLMEDKDKIQEKMENNLQRSIHQLGHTIPLLYRKLWNAYRKTDNEIVCARAVMEAVAPSGTGMCSVRLQGIGRLMLSFKGTEQNITLVNARTEGKEEFTWDDIMDVLSLLMIGETPEESWETVYGEPFPENSEVAPVQPEKKQSKVIKTEPTPELKKRTGQEPKKEAKKSPEAAGVPEEIGPERLPKGNAKGDGISWKEPKEQEFKPIELPPQDAEYNLPIGKTMLQDIKAGLRYLILKKHDPYRVGNTLHLYEQMDGEAIGNEMDIKITYMTDDHGGITEGYCVLQFDILPVKETQLPGQINLEDMEQQDREE